MITYISYFAAGGYNDFYRELNEQDYDVMLDDTPRGNSTTIYSIYVLETKCGQLKLNYCSASAELVDDDAKGREYLNNILTITKY